MRASNEPEKIGTKSRVTDHSNVISSIQHVPVTVKRNTFVKYSPGQKPENAGSYLIYLGRRSGESRHCLCHY